MSGGLVHHLYKYYVISENMNPADNPVGALFERYQTTGAPMPEIEVALTSILTYFKFTY